MFRLGAIFSLVAFPVLAAASPFQNLDFEQTTVPDSTPFFSNVSTAVLFPSWNVQIEGVTQQFTQVVIYLDQDGISLISSRSSDPPSMGNGRYVIQGSYNAYLSSGLYGTGVSLSQSGEIPADVRSLTFQARNPFYPSDTYFPGAFDIQINGTSLPNATLNSNAADRTFGVDVSAYAGQSVDLRVGLHAVDQNVTPHRQEGAGLLDNLIFSTNAIPEPANLAVVSLAGILFRRRTSSPTR